VHLGKGGEGRARNRTGKEFDGASDRKDTNDTKGSGPPLRRTRRAIRAVPSAGCRIAGFLLLRGGGRREGDVYTKHQKEKFNEIGKELGTNLTTVIKENFFSTKQQTFGQASRGRGNRWKS